MEMYVPPPQMAPFTSRLDAACHWDEDESVALQYFDIIHIYYMHRVCHKSFFIVIISTGCHDIFCATADTISLEVRHNRYIQTLLGHDFVMLATTLMLPFTVEDWKSLITTNIDVMCL